VTPPAVLAVKCRSTHDAIALALFDEPPKAAPPPPAPAPAIK